MKSLIDILELSEQEIMELVNTACDIIDHPAEYAHKCDGRILATLFFEPSTRTRLSFESAMLEIGEGKDAQLTEGTSGYIVCFRGRTYKWEEGRDYLWPIPTDQRVATGGALSQNPGYEDGLSF